MLRPSRPWRSPLQARDLRDETPWAALPPSCLPCSLPSLPPCVTAHHAPSLPRPRNRLVASGVGALPRPSLGGRLRTGLRTAPDCVGATPDRTGLGLVPEHCYSRSLTGPQGGAVSQTDAIADRLRRCGASCIRCSMMIRRTITSRIKHLQAGFVPRTVQL